MNNFANDMAKLMRRVNTLEQNKGASLRFAHVVGHNNGQVRVKLSDGQDVVTDFLPILQSRVLKDQFICLPDINEPVAVLFSGKGFENGVVLGAVYSENTKAPEQETHIEYKKFEDGTEITYDRKKHLLKATIEGDADITVRKNLIAKVEKNASLDVGENLTATIGKDASITVSGSLSAKASKGISLESPDNISLTAPIIKLAGNLAHGGFSGGVASSELQGNFKVRNGAIDVVDKDVTAGSVSLRGHVHNGVESGSASTNKPV